MSKLRELNSVIILLSFAIIVSNIGFKSIAQESVTTGKKVVMIIAKEGFRDEELQTPKAILEKSGIMVIVASSSLESAKGMLGSVVKPDILINDIKVEDYNAVIFVGGVGVKEYWDNPTAHSIANKAVELNKVIGAICIAPVILANAGVLSGKKATVWSSESNSLDMKGAIYTGETVQIDGKIITANGPEAAEKFGKAILEALSE